MTEYLDWKTDWDVVAWYDELPLWSAPFGVMLLENVPLRRNMTVLDVGCGTGFPLVELAQRLGGTCKVCGLDPWQPALERARRRLGALGVTNVELVEGSAEAMPFEDARFDLVVSNLGINNFDNAAAALAEARRVLVPAGEIALTTNLCGHMALFYETYEETLKELGRCEWLDSLDKHVRHRTTLENLTGMLTTAGFVVRRVEQRSVTMRFVDGAALLRHAFIRLTFLDAWRQVVPPAAETSVFEALERNLNRRAARDGCLALTVPMAYVEAQAAG